MDGGAVCYREGLVDGFAEAQLAYRREKGAVQTREGCCEASVVAASVVLKRPRWGGQDQKGAFNGGSWASVVEELVVKLARRKGCVVLALEVEG